MSAQNKAKPTITLPDGLSSELRDIGAEALRIHESAVYSSQSQFEQAKIWRALNIWLGAPAAVAAALAASAILGGTEQTLVFGIKGDLLAGLLALLSAALSSILTTVNASRRTTQCQASGNAFLQLQTEARQLILVDLKHLSFEDGRGKLESITNSRNELLKTADPAGRFAYLKAKKNIEKLGGQSYAVDKKD
ncbi:SLATT domain-containing protein [Aldersonia kunmingensis]|uniref:SLATT domain-containing protein n=1 Tax=Aldersonia kunmingensis TaxID=408066 RepID=UPI000A022A77|nr:SLATT domain-containing protein [Aldersonia kunmingensis]